MKAGNAAECGMERQEKFLSTMGALMTIKKEGGIPAFASTYIDLVKS